MNNTKNGVIILRASRKMKAVFLSFVVICVLAYLGFQSDWFQRRYMYPFPYQMLVVEYADARKLDSQLVAGVILSESNFKLDAQSHKGAQGLMQIMPETANWIADQIEYRPFSLDELQDPEISIRFGTWYLASLKKEFHGNEVLMLAAYNAGRGNVKEWMTKYNWDMSFNDAAQIPFKETREYVAKVLRSKAKYEKLYPKE